MRARVGKLVKAGMFDDASASRGATRTTSADKSTNQKLGTTDVSAKEEDGKEETEVE